MDNDLTDLFNILLVSTALTFTCLGDAFAKGGGGGGHGGGGHGAGHASAHVGGGKVSGAARATAARVATSSRIARTAAASRGASINAAARAANASGKISRLANAGKNAQTLNLKQAGMATHMPVQYRMAANEMHFGATNPNAHIAVGNTPKYTFPKSSEFHTPTDLPPHTGGDGGNGGGKGGGKEPPREPPEDPPRYKRKDSGGGGKPSYESAPTTHYTYYGHGGHAASQPQEAQDDPQLECMKKTLRFNMAVDEDTMSANAYLIVRLKRTFDEARRKGESTKYLDLNFFEDQVRVAYNTCIIDK